ncbi:MAG: hypothetical protein Kow00121_10490 [Elainellaceae cyanobacterium]
MLPRHLLLGSFIATLWLAFPVLLPSALAAEIYAAAAQSAHQGRDEEAAQWIEEGNQQYQESQWQSALQSYQAALEIYRAIHDQPGEADALRRIGTVYAKLEQYSLAIEQLEASVTIAKQLEDAEQAAQILVLLGSLYYITQNYEYADEAMLQAITFWQALGRRQHEAATWSRLGAMYLERDLNRKAAEFFEQALVIFREIGDRVNEGQVLYNLARSYRDRHQFSQALAYYQQVLEIAGETNQPFLTGIALFDIGVIHDAHAAYSEALESYQQALTISQTIENRDLEASILREIGETSINSKQFPQALEAFEQVLAIAKQINDRSLEGATLNRIAIIYSAVGQNEQALDLLQEALKIIREVGDRREESNILLNLAELYREIEQYDLALKFYQQAIVVAQSTDNPQFLEEFILFGQQAVLVQQQQTTSQQALEFYQQLLAQTPDSVSTRHMKSIILDRIGMIYHELGQSEEGLAHLQQALAITQEVKDPFWEAWVFSNIGSVFADQNQPELAILFYKQFANRLETIRQSIQVFPSEWQESFTQRFADRYRRLADLLLQQDRIYEAQQVLDLLKVQELDNYLGGVRGTDDRLTILRPEEEILKQYNALQQTAIQIGQELTQLRQRLFQGETLTDAENRRIDQLETLQEAINQQFSTFIASAEIQALVAQLSPRAVQQNISLPDLAGLQDDLTTLNAVLLYPLILDDRLELVITTPSSAPLRRTVNVSKADLNRLISDLRQALRDPNIDPTPLAQQLYQYLIEPIEPDLSQVAENLPDGQPPTIIYAPDAALRYIPLAALHDGNQWLVQRYRINNITAQSLTEFQSDPVSSPRVLAGAFADEAISYRVSIDGQEEEFRGLPFAGQEVENLASLLPNITEFIDRNFSWATIRRYMGASDIVHFATHAAFVPGDPQNSFILFGNGDRAVLECITPPTSESQSCINNWSLSNIDLVVLSACETGLSGQLTDGEEILGLGYQFQTRGARAVVASLWKVSDGGTQALMNAFYAALQQDGISKSEALRQAQIALITGDYTALENTSRGIVELRQRIEADVPPDISAHLDHPYYWAPFILIGNGL